LRSELGVRIRHDDHVILGAAKRLNALSVASGRLIYMLRYRRGTDEAHRRDVLMRDQRIDGFAVTIQDVEDTRRKACFGQ
jgi:hypothetical protein